MDFLNLVTLVGSALAVALGMWLKTNPRVSNRAIPWATLAVSLLTQVVQTATSAEAQTAASTPAGAASWALAVIGLAAAQALAITGAYSFWKNGVRGKVGGSTAIAIAALCLAAWPATASPPRWDLSRAAGGLDAGAAVWDQGQDGPRVSSFLPGVWLSYSLSQRIAAAASAYRDFPRRLSVKAAGGSLQLYGDQPGDRMHLFLLAQFVHYDDGAPGDGLEFRRRASWRAGPQLAWSMLQTPAKRTVVYLLVADLYDPENGTHQARGLFSWQAFGGKP